MLTANQIHACEYDGIAAAHRLLLLLNEHLHPSAYASQEERTEAAHELLNAFCNVFAGAIVDAGSTEAMMDAIVRDAPDMLARLNR